MAVGTDGTRRDADGLGARRLLRSARPVLWGAVAVVVVGLLTGVLFSRTDPRRAATLLLGEQVRTEPEGEMTTGPAPSSGEGQDGPSCGMVAEPVDTQTQIDALAAGVAVVQYRDAEDAVRVSEALADRPTRVLVAPNPDVDVPVVATAWGRRLRLQAVDGPMLRAFVTAHAGIGPDVVDCMPDGRGIPSPAE